MPFQEIIRPSREYEHSADQDLQDSWLHAISYPSESSPFPLGNLQRKPNETEGLIYSITSPLNGTGQDGTEQYKDDKTVIC
jgi:hypothetical protein